MTKTARFYLNRPVRRMYRVGDKICIVLLAKKVGDRGETMHITQAEWDKHGEKREVLDNSLPALRKFA